MKVNLFCLLVILNLIHNILNERISPCLSARECRYSGTTISCSEHGICFYDLFKYVSEDSVNKKFIDCICDEGYITESEDEEIKCCYEQKLQKYALLLELLPLGFGHYYCGRYINFCIKVTFQSILILCVGIFGCCCQSMSRKKRYHGYEALSNGSHNKNDFLFDSSMKIQITSSQLITNAVFLVSMLTLVIWQILDIFLFGLNVYTDSNSIELKKW